MKSVRKFGFSLLEISIVLVIITVLIVSVMQGGEIVRKSKVASANMLTKTSPVQKIDGLVAWWESTMPTSFSNLEEVDNGRVGTWYDISDVSNSPLNATQTTVSSKPTYKTGNINGLPALYFDGSDSLAFDGVKLNNTFYTIFVVEQRKSATGYFFGTDAGSRNGGFAIGYGSSTAFRNLHYWGSFGWNDFTVAAYATPEPRITVNSYGYQNGDTKQAFYNNGSGPTYGTAINAPGYKTTFYIGTADATNFTGDIAEIIVYNRLLTDQERKDVEAYLGEKWGITVS